MFNVSADHSWLGFAEVALLVLGSGIFSVITAVVGARLTRGRSAATRTAVGRLEEQIVNSHGENEENLRDQIDMIRDTVGMIHQQLGEHSRAIRRIEGRLENPRRPV